jgi:putative transposase
MSDAVAREDDSMTPFGPPGVSQAEAARRAVDAMVEAGLFDTVMAQVDTGELRLTGEGGFLPEMLKRSLEAGLRAELTSHLGYEKGDPAGQGSGNSRNGTTPKRLGTEVGDLDLATPRDRNGTFDPQLVGKGQRRLDGLADMIISLYAKGMTVRDIQHHLLSTLGTELSHETISNITEAVAAEVKLWQARPLEAVYPIVYLDALVVKVRDGHQVRNKAAHIAVGVDCDGVKHVLGIWVQASEGAKFWAGVCAELANRGVRDVLIACCDGLTGFPEAIEATWPHTVVQTSSMHHGVGGIVPSVTRAVSVRTCADVLPSRSRCRPVRPGRWRALHLPAGAAPFERRDEVPTRPANARVAWA